MAECPLLAQSGHGTALADFAFGGKADILFARWTRRIGFCSGGEGSGSSPPISELTAQISAFAGINPACSTNPALPAAAISVVGNWL